jgi:hypothetical protein
VCGCAFIVRTCVPLKRVRLTQDTLLISNYWREIRVPLRDVHDVTESRWINIHPVTLHLRHPTAFGSRVVFMPKTRWFGSWWPHPIVVGARGARPTGPSLKGTTAANTRGSWDHASTCLKSSLLTKNAPVGVKSKGGISLANSERSPAGHIVYPMSYQFLGAFLLRACD